MPSTGDDFLMSRFAGALALILAVSLFATASAAEDHARIIVTANIQNLYPRQSSAPEAKDAALKFEKELQKRKEADPNAYLAQAANSISIVSSVETYYSAAAPQMFMKNNYDVVNLNTRDNALGTVLTHAYQLSPKEYTKRLITNLGTHDIVKTVVDLPASLLVHKPGEMPVTFLSLGSLKEAPALSGKITYMNEADGAVIAKAIDDARAAKSLVVGFNSYGDEDLKKLLPDESKRPDVLLDILPGRSPEPEKFGNGWRLPVPGAGEFYVLDVTRDGTGKVLEPRVERIRYMSAGDYAKLIDFPVPMAGWTIPNVSAVRDQFFPEADKAVGEQRYPVDEPQLTSLKEVTVITLRMHGEDFRGYRVSANRPSSSIAGAQDPGWPWMDMIVLINKDHLVERVVSRVGFSLNGSQTTIVESLSALRNKKPEEWTPDPTYARGAEEMWEWGAFTIRKVMELDRKLFPDKK
ncbi:hypothetical protein IT570_00335 [Candidatus Sumerlaeota bacterium]|nr:hypothetical protein [Candidatus Sumerlaeota bacterium]